MKSKVIITTKKLIAVLLTLLIISSVLPSFTVKTSAAGITATTPNKDGNGVYQIGTAAELYGFAELVNNGKTDKNTKAVLTKDIVVNTGVLNDKGELNSGTFTDWTPIGWYDYDNYVDYSYTGTFDGQGHTISGLYFNDTSADDVGLFGWLDSGGEIKNVGVIDSYIRGYSYVGGVCGYNYKGAITGCYNTGTVSGTEYVGGVCGRNTYGTITGCYNTGTVSSTGEYVGGVCGHNWVGKITGCYNTGTVSGTGNEVGGVCGWNAGGTITGCYNTGTVSGSSYVGGVCGCNSSTGTITGCYTNNGGVCGTNDGTVTDCDEYTGDEFTNGTVCGLLNTALKNYGSDVRFYQGANYPKLCVIPESVSGVYQISTAAELYGFAQLVNGGNKTASAVLTADIVVNTGVLNSKGELNSGTFDIWTPIGNTSQKYTGKFDGQGHTISGLYFNDTSADDVGLFGCLGSGGEIKNVGVIDSYIRGYTYVGGICGENNSGTITGCYNTGTVSGSRRYVGGVCGYNWFTITGSYNTGKVSGGSYVGGVCGYNSRYGTMTGCYTNNGGVYGHNNGGTVTDCGVKSNAEFKNATVCGLLNTALKNYGSSVRFYQGVESPEFIRTPQLVDGVYQISCASELYGFAQLVNKLEPSANAVLTADITVNNNLLSSLEFDGNGNVTNGGSFESWTTIGYYDSSTEEYFLYSGTFDGQGHTISGLYFNDTNAICVGLFGYLGSGGEIKNTGVIDSYFNGGYFVGGVCGLNNGTITGSYNTGTVSGTSNIGGVCGKSSGGTTIGCYNTGTVSGDYEVGGVCGNNYKGTITGCYNTETVSGKSNVGGVCGANDGGTITGCYTYTNKGGVCGSNSGGGKIDDCDEYTYNKNGDEFTDTTVCGLLNAALKNYGSSVRFYQGVKSPEFIHAPQLVDGVYQIGTVAELYWFAGLVNGTLTDGTEQNTSASAVLTADIIVNKDVLNDSGELNSGTFTDWTPIGNYNNQYTGKFDGQGHTISGLYFNDVTAYFVGLFSYLSDGEIKNVGVIDSYFNGRMYVGGVCGLNNSTSTGTITGCYNTGTVSGSFDVGGVCGANNTTITGCYNTGTVSNGDYVGGVCGFNGGTITGCYNIGTVSGSDYVGGVCGENNNTITGCYTNNKDICGLNNGTISSDCAEYNGNEFKDNTVCKLLNTALKNANSDVRYYQGANYPELSIIPNLPDIVDGVYQISNKLELYAFAQLVNSGAKPSANAVLTADITVNDFKKTPLKFDADNNVTNGDSFESWTQIGYYDLSTDDYVLYSGTFDGQGHTISGLYFNDTNAIYVGLFGFFGSDGEIKCEIKNVGVIDSYFKGNVGVGGVCGYNYQGTITGCYNTGTVSSSGGYVGGVCGWNNGTITGCYNTGTVSSSGDYVGGVCSYNDGGIITGCYNTGTVSGSSSVGGVYGVNDKGTITDCYTNRSGDTYYKSDEEFKNGTVCGLLNTALKNASSNVLFCQRIGTDDSPLLTYQFKSVDEHTYEVYTVDVNKNTFNATCLCGKKDTKTMELTLTTQKNVVVNGAANTLTATLSNLDDEVVTYKWYQNGVEIPNETSSTYSMPTDLALGTYTYRVDVTMEGVGTISQTVDILVDIAPQYYVEIPATNVNVGGSFTVSASNVLLKNNAQLKVSLESDFVLSNEKGTSLNYEIFTDNGKINSGDTLLTVAGSDNPTAPGSGTSETYNVALAQGEKPKHSGNYTDTLTFTIKVEP